MENQTGYEARNGYAFPSVGNLSRADCFSSDFLQGGCPVQAVHEVGAIDAPDHIVAGACFRVQIWRGLVGEAYAMQRSVARDE